MNDIPWLQNCVMAFERACRAAGARPDFTVRPDEGLQFTLIDTFRRDHHYIVTWDELGLVKLNGSEFGAQMCHRIISGAKLQGKFG